MRPFRSVARALVAALAALMVLGVLSPSPPAGADPAQDADATVNALRADADRAAAEYFDALGRAQALDSRIAELERRLPELAAQRRNLQRQAEERAVAAYKRSGAQIAAVIASGDALTAARRNRWLDRLNAHDNDTFGALLRISNRLDLERQQMREARTAQTDALARLAAQGRDIDAKLQAAEDRSRQIAAAAAAAPAPAKRPVNPTAPGGAPPSAPPDYQPAPGTHARHDDPFLVCTRAHEGSYTSYNPAGPHMGAYQFLQSTWNSAANHAGRSDLVGVPPHTASPYDQDDVAWALYQWQGAAPWGGSCA